MYSLRASLIGKVGLLRASIDKSLRNFMSSVSRSASGVLETAICTKREQSAQIEFIPGLSVDSNRSISFIYRKREARILRHSGLFKYLDLGKVILVLNYLLKTKLLPKQLKEL